MEGTIAKGGQQYQPSSCGKPGPGEPSRAAKQGVRTATVIPVGYDYIIDAVLAENERVMADLGKLL